MTLDLSPLSMTNGQLAGECARETSLFFRRSVSPCPCCYELFRRALDGGNQQAWASIYAQYAPLVAGWVTRHPQFSSSGEEVDYYVNQAFERMWSAIGAGRFGQFRDLRALMAYLKMCVHTAILDVARKAGPPRRELPPELEESEIPDGHSLEGEVVEQDARGRLWELVEARLNERERIVIRCLFVLDLKPAAIQQRYPDHFPQIREIYRLRQNALERLARDPDLNILSREYA
jgi:DNA-directed RNA polymerase specialized sigma24 family protein